MATFKLKNNSQESGTVPGVGVYVNGVLNNAPDNFENPNFERVTEQSAPAPAAPSVPVAPPVSPAIIGAAPQVAPSNLAAPMQSVASPVIPTQQGAN